MTIENHITLQVSAALAKFRLEVTRPNSYVNHKNAEQQHYQAQVRGSSTQQLCKPNNATQKKHFSES